MPRQIDADALREHIAEARKDAGFYSAIYDGFLNTIDRFPTIEAEPVKWIPVTERLPKEWVEVLVWSRCGFHQTAVYIGIPGEWRITWNHVLLEEGTVTHWMPLPKPPGMDQT